MTAVCVVTEIRSAQTEHVSGLREGERESVKTYYALVPLCLVRMESSQPNWVLCNSWTLC